MQSALGALNEVVETLRSLDLTNEICAERTLEDGGAYYDVFRGIFIGGAKKVAIRQLRPFLHKDPQFVKRLARELKLWSVLSHPNILPLLGFTLVQGVEVLPSFVTEWMDNGSARRFLESNPGFDLAHLIKGIAKGLEYLHSMDVVHCDLKGDNVLITSNGDAVVADFGISHLLSMSSRWSTTGGIKGSVRWMAAELFTCSTNENSFTKEADVWAFGMTVCELLTRLVPYHDVPQVQVLYEIMKGHLPSCPPNLSQVEHELWKICEQCWKKDPRRRPQMARLVVDIEKLELIPISPSSEMSRGGLFRRFRTRVTRKLSTNTTSQSSISALDTAIEQALQVNEMHTLAKDITVYCVQFSPDGRTVAVGCDRVVLFDVETGDRQSAIALNKGRRALQMCFRRGGKYLAVQVVGVTSDIFVLDTTTGKSAKTFRSQDISSSSYLYSPVFSKDGKSLVFGDEGGFIHIYDTAKDERRSIGLHSKACSLTISPDGRDVAVGFYDGMLRIFRVATGEQVLQWFAHDSDIKCIALTPSGDHLLSGCGAGAIKLWNLTSVLSSEDRAPESTLDAGDASRHGVRAVGASRDSEWIMTLTQSGILELWHRRQAFGTSAWKIDGEVDRQAFAFSPTADVFATAEGYRGVKLWKYTTSN